MLTIGCGVAGQLAGRKGAVVANTNLVKIAIHNGLKYYMLAPLPRGKGARKRAELGLSVRLLFILPLSDKSIVMQGCMLSEPLPLQSLSMLKLTAGHRFVHL